MRLIDADALMSAVMAQDVVDKSVVKRLIIQAPTVDAVEVVRCVDCKFYSRCTDHQGICTNRYMDGFIVPDWFCADGEVRDDDI